MPDKQGESLKGRLNIYVCRICRGHIVTRDVDDGVTPFMLGCQATPGCAGAMQSSMYRVFDQTMRESHQWYKPASVENRALDDAVRDHVERGGLLIREATS